MSARSSLSGSRSAISRIPLIVSLENPTSGPSEGPTSFQTIRVGCGTEWIDIELHRTLRVPRDEQIRAAPPGFGPFPLYVSDQFTSTLPSSINGGAFLPIYQREALWIRFNCVRPFRVKVFVDGVNIITGHPTIRVPDRPLVRSVSTPNMMQVPQSQDYFVAPKQIWVDGMIKGEDVVEQIIARPVDDRYTTGIGHFITNQNEPVKIRFEVTPTKNREGWFYVNLVTETTAPKFRVDINPKESIMQTVNEMLMKMGYPTRKIARISYEGETLDYFDCMQNIGVNTGDTVYVYTDDQVMESEKSNNHSGNWAGQPAPRNRSPARSRRFGGVRQVIYPDFIPATEWDTKNRLVFPIHLIRACDFKATTGLDPPKTPVSSAMYTKYKLILPKRLAEPGLMEDPEPEEEDANKWRLPPGAENVYELPADYFQDNDSLKTKTKKIFRIANI